jgi:enolase
MVLIVLRHGESEWNSLNKFTGWENPNLSQKGIEEAKIVGQLLYNYKFNFVYTSDLVRTVQTARLVMQSNQYNNYNEYNLKELRERNYGDLTGKNKSELEKEYGSKQIRLWRRGWIDKPPGGENLEEVSKRVGFIYENHINEILKSNSNSNILIVAHGNSLRALFVHLGLKTEETIQNFEIGTGIPIKINLETKQFDYINRYKLIGTQILDSRGFPTIQVECVDLVTNKSIGKGSTPSGASCGSTEVLELRDGDKTKFMGKSVFKAISNLEMINNKMCLSKLTDLLELDAQLNAIDSTQYKEILGGNLTTAVSFCLADTGAKLLDLELYEYFAKIYSNNTIKITLPTPMVNIINGGKHGVTEDLKIQEFMIVCNKTFSIEKQIQIICEVYHGLKQILVKRYGMMAKSIGDEGGFCPPIYSGSEAIQTICDAIVYAGYKEGLDVFVALDCASSEFYSESTKLYEVEKGLFVNSTQLVDYYENLVNKFPCLISIEDGFAESDYEGWAEFNQKLGSKIMIVGDDLFTTNPKLIANGLDKGLANSLLLKVNQIGTISESVLGAKLMFEKDLNVIVSHRSGETNHAYIVDLAVGIGAQYLKIGSPCRGERVAKFNRLIEIDNLINNKNK